MSTGSKRKDLTLKQKLTVIEYAQESKANQNEVARKFGIFQAQVSTFLKNKDSVLSDWKITGKDLENVEQETEDVLNAGISFTATVDPSKSLDWLPDNNNAKTFCVVCKKECSLPNFCGSCDKAVYAVCRIINEAEEGYAEKLLAGYAIINKKSGKRSLAAKFPPAKIGDNVRIRIPDIDRGRGDPRSVLAVVANVKGAFYKLGTEHGALH
ncbi:hypothetical protein ILUMI_00235 [Ignelater luminosus]|uniref:HTH psq-type domain-containing protein n=1 Tax=Ignelater luminosus TaxID=2038154 RepID=A0A8K0GIL5_IGNLU|nr:hypothetical protein ILUMI_00235 [Ignelater luminosus]